MDNYLDLFSDEFSLANSVSGEELNKKIHDAFVLKTKKYQEEFSQMRSRLIEGINLTNQENLNAFIPKN
jgi:LPS O-antigen subunit length determinant protein (WzzB/FepE family)